VMVRAGTPGLLTSQEPGYAPTTVAAFDFQGGAQDDIAQIQAGSTSTSVSVLALDAQGMLAPVARYAVEVSAPGAVTGDFDGDGSVDLALLNASSVTVLLNVPATTPE
jgi:hypothetical protein